MNPSINKSSPQQAGQKLVQNTKCPWCKDDVPDNKIKHHKDTCPNRPRAIKDRGK